jgi:hypothetical protein
VWRDWKKSNVIAAVSAAGAIGVFHRSSEKLEAPAHSLQHNSDKIGHSDFAYGGLLLVLIKRLVPDSKTPLDPYPTFVKLMPEPRKQSLLGKAVI